MTPPHSRQSRSFDVAVIGAGITGITTALLLVREGKSVVVLERRKAGEGNTGLSTAHLTECLDLRYHELIARRGEQEARIVARAHREAIETIASLVAEVPACGFRRVPGFLFTEDEAGRAEIEREAEAVFSLGIGGALTRDVPLPFPAPMALRFDDQAQLEPKSYLRGLAESLRAEGGVLMEDVAVSDVEDGNPCRVTIEGGLVLATDVIVATHVPVFNRVLLHTKLVPYRTYVIAVQAPASVPDGLYWDLADPYHYVRTQGSGPRRELIVGGEDHHVGRIAGTGAPFAQLEDYAQSHFESRGVQSQWSGQIIETIDGLPLIGRNSLAKHVYVATGYAGNGMTLGTVAATLLTDLVLGRDNELAPIVDATRVPVGEAGTYVQENAAFPAHFLRDRMGLDHDVAELCAGQGKVVASDGRKLAVSRDDAGKLHVLSAVCTHLGCLVHWNASAKSWDCPCHGSRFDTDGAVLDGPALRPLPEIAMEQPAARPRIASSSGRRPTR